MCGFKIWYEMCAFCVKFYESRDIGTSAEIKITTIMIDILTKNETAGDLGVLWMVVGNGSGLSV